MSDYKGDQFRVKTWDSYVGQDKLKEQLNIHIEAAVKTGKMLPHILLAGPAGMGKTSIAEIIAFQTGDPFESLTMPVKPAVLASFLRQFGGGILFLDEIHRLSVSAQEDLLTLLESGYLQLANGRRIQAPDLTIVAATTEPDKIIPPLLDRFPIKPRFVDYSPDEMFQIISGMAEKAGLSFDADTAGALGRATGGIPRGARSIVLAARALTDTGRDVNVDSVLDLAGLDPDGLTLDHQEYMRILNSLGGQAGLSTLVSMLQLHQSVVKDLERLLLKQGLLQYGERGRELTNPGFAKASGKPVYTRQRVVS